MLRRRDLLIGTGLTALGACAPKPRAAAPHAPAGPAAPSGETPPLRWPPYGQTMAIDGAGGPWLLIPDDTPADEAARQIAVQIAACKVSGLTAAIYTVAPRGLDRLTDAAFERTKSDIAIYRARIAEHPEALRLIESAADLDAAHRQRLFGLVFTFQGTEPLGEDPERIPMYRQLGVRVIQLTHNRRNLVGDGATEPSNAGLSRYGYQIVERLNAARIVVDLAHGSQRTMRDGIAASKAPMLISHTGCRALSDLPRCTPDAELRAMADKGGVAGIIFWPYLRTDTQPMAIDVIRHIEHAIQVCGEDHVGLGTDTPVEAVERTPEFERENRAMIADMVTQGIFERGRPADLYTFIPDLNAANRFEVLAAMLAARGHSEPRISKLLGGNFARVMREVWG